MRLSLTGPSSILAISIWEVRGWASVGFESRPLHRVPFDSVTYLLEDGPLGGRRTAKAPGRKAPGSNPASSTPPGANSHLRLPMGVCTLSRPGRARKFLAL